MKALSRTRAVGGSLMVTVPKEVVVQEGLYPDQAVEIEVKKIRKSYFGVLKGMAPWNKKEDALDAHD